MCAQISLRFLSLSLQQNDHSFFVSILLIPDVIIVVNIITNLRDVVTEMISTIAAEYELLECDGAKSVGKDTNYW